MKKYLLLIIIFFLTYTCAIGQNSSRMKNQSWVRIMKDETGVNYFKAQKDYSKFKNLHQKEEAKRIEARKKQEAKAGVRIPNETHLEDPEEAVMMAYEKWAKSMKPFVDCKGNVMPIEKRLEMIQTIKANQEYK